MLRKYCESHFLHVVESWIIKKNSILTLMSTINGGVSCIAGTYIYNLFFHHPHSTSNYFPVMSTLSSAVFLKVDSECSRSNPFKNSFLIKEPPLESLLEECLRWKWKSLTSFAFGSMAQFFTLKIVPSRPLRWKSLLVLLLSSGFLSP